jgi:hypothetical protein
MVRILLFSISLFLLSSCATPGTATLSDLNYALADLQRLCINALPLGKRFESLNNREYYSEYFVTKGGEFESAQGKNFRMTVHIILLGDRRPYKIQISVPVEKRMSNGHYQLVKYDEGLAKMISRRMSSALHKRRDDRNIIDDFRVF